LHQVGLTNYFIPYVHFQQYKRKIK